MTFHGDVELVRLASLVIAMALVSGTIGLLSAFAYRWYSGDEIPEGIAILLGVSVIAVWLNTTDTLQAALLGDELFDVGAAAFTISAFAAGTVLADLGRRLGGRLAGDLPAVSSVRTLDRDVGQLVRAAGRVIRVTIPGTIHDIDGYEPVSGGTKAELAGATLLFPRGLTVDELRERLGARLKDDYDVGHVDVELTERGEVEYLALGRRVAGVGQTLAPGTAAVALRADPAFSATPGDRVQVWRDGETPRRVATGELRAAVGEVATVVVDETDATAFEEGAAYRLVTLPSDARPDREFASLLRAADETMAAIRIEAGSELDGAAVGTGDATVAAVKGSDEVVAIPPHDRTMAAGETLYAVGRLDALRRLEAMGRASEPSGEPAPEQAPADAVD